MDFHGPGGQATSRPYKSWPEMWKQMSYASEREEKHEWTVEKPKLDNA